jgi:hypothetical protein
MAWIEQRRRADGGLTARVFWRPGGCVTLPVSGRHSAPARTRRTSRVRTVSSGWSRPLVSGGPMAG